MAAKRRKKLSRGAKLLLLAIAAAIFGGGLYLGIELGKPPPPPDLSRLASPAPADSTASPTNTSDAASQNPSEAASGGVSEAESESDPAEATDESTELHDAETASVPLVCQPAPGTQDGVRIALVIDDMGRSVTHVERLAALDVPVTFAVLPFEVRTAEVVRALVALEAEYIVHLPMEARGDADPGPGALGASMDAEELVAATRQALDRVPGARGVNNHMGSAVMTDASAMQVVLAELKRRDLYFLDSRTASETVGYTLARHLGVPAAERQVFLDTTRDREAIRRQFDRLLAVAEERGGAIGIAHPYEETLDVLVQGIPRARQRGIEFVTVSRLLDR